MKNINFIKVKVAVSFLLHWFHFYFNLFFVPLGPCLKTGRLLGREEGRGRGRGLGRLTGRGRSLWGRCPLMIDGAGLPGWRRKEGADGDPVTNEDWLINWLILWLRLLDLVKLIVWWSRNNWLIARLCYCANNRLLLELATLIVWLSYKNWLIVLFSNNYCVIEKKTHWLKSIGWLILRHWLIESTDGLMVGYYGLSNTIW